MTATRAMNNLGTQQSPIDLTDTLEADIQVAVRWSGLVLEPKDDGYTPPRKLSARPSTKAGHLLFDKERYVPVDLHWHFPSEHRRKGKSYAAEVHIVHVHKEDMPYALQGKLDWCRIVVLGVFVKSGSAAYAPMAAAAAEGSSKVAREDILPDKSRAVRVIGSLTTPPYSENVTFVVFETPVTARASQLADGGLPNARPLQDRNRRCCLAGDVAF